MKLNENLKVVGQNVILVPYESIHVPKYHKWMQNEELRELTASEPLTLEQEYQMQRSWREDDDKCTFLVLDRKHYETPESTEISALIGDTNIFLLPSSDDDDEAGTGGDGHPSTIASRTGEIEIMIAETGARGKHYGWEATLLMLAFGVEHLAITCYRAITKDSNERAMAMFRRMHFREVKRTAVFQEVTFERPVDEWWRSWLQRTVTLSVLPYRE